MTFSPASLVLDLQAVQSAEHAERGIARYVQSQARALLQRPGAVRAMLLNPLLPFPAGLDRELIFSDLLHWNSKDIFDTAISEGPTVYNIMSPFELGPPPESLVIPHVMTSGVPLAVTVYDVIPLIMKHIYLVDPKLRARYECRLRLLRRADLLLAISDSTRNDVVRELGIPEARVQVIGAGVDPVFCLPDAAQRSLPDSLQSHCIEPGYIVSVLGEEPRKNLSALIEAYARLSPPLRADHQLVVVGRYRPEVREHHLAEAHRLGVAAGRVVITGTVDDPELVSLYQNASLFVFPSLYEGFGLPVAEAIACGCPAIVSNISSLPEILDWAPATFDPTRADDMAALMTRSLSDSGFRSELCDVADARSRTHTWERVAERTMEAVCQVPVPRSRSSVRTRPSRIALVGPLPPARCGIADYNHHVIEALARRCRLDVFDSAKQMPHARATPVGARILPINALGRTANPAAYDAVIYTLGNSEHHTRTLDMALKYPGIVWLHDVCLYGLYVSSAARLGSMEQAISLLREKVESMYGTRAPQAPDPTRYCSHEWYIRYRLTMSVELMRRSSGVIVHSPHALSLLSVDQPALSCSPPSFVLPLAFRSIQPSQHRPTESPRWIVSFGAVSPVKSPELLLQAFACLVEHRDVNLAFVGTVPDDIRLDILAKATELGVADRLHLTGYTRASDYTMWLQKASCAVQLRAASNGESSGAVNDCISAGLPVITNAPGCFGMPDDVAVRLPVKPSPEQLAQCIDRVLSVPDFAAAHTEAPSRYAAAHDFDALAQRLVNVVVEVGRERSLHRMCRSSAG